MYMHACMHIHEYIGYSQTVRHQDFQNFLHHSEILLAKLPSASYDVIHHSTANSDSHMQSVPIHRRDNYYDSNGFSLFNISAHRTYKNI